MRDYRPVIILFISSGINGVLLWLKNSIWLVVCVSGRFVNYFWTAFTTVFALQFTSIFNQLGSALIHTIHTTNKYNNDLYKLIITN